MSDEQQSSENDKNVEIWKVKKLIKSLQAARGNGTSMISLIIPPGDQISRVSKMLADEYGTASNIKSRVNRCPFEYIGTFSGYLLSSQPLSSNLKATPSLT